MTKQKKAIVAIACTSGLSLVVWMTSAVLYWTSERPVAASSASPMDRIAGDTRADTVVEIAEASSDSVETFSKASLEPQPNDAVPPVETKPDDHNLNGKFPFSVLEKPITGITVDPSHQRILLIGPQENSLSVMGMSQIGQESPPLQAINVDGTPVAVALKKWQYQTLYVVATVSPARLVLIDSESLEVVRRVQLNSFSPQRLWDHLDATNPMIVIGKNPEKFEFKFDSRRGFVRGTSNALEFDIESMAVTRTSHGLVWDVSPDGHCLFTLERSPMNFGPFPHQTETSPIHADSIDDTPLANQTPALVDDMVVMGRTLFRTQKLSDQIGMMEFHVLSSMAGTTLLAGTIGQTFRVGTRNDMHTLFDIDLPNEWKLDSKSRRSYEPRKTFVVADPVKKTFVLASVDRIAAFPLPEMGIKAIRDLSLTANVPIASVGERLSASINGRSTLHTLKLEKAPKGLTLQSNAIDWTPTIDQVGEHEIAIRHTAGEESAVSEFMIRVERSGLDLSFQVLSVLDSPNGGPALITGNRLNAQRNWESMVASVDLETKKILASRQTVEHANFLVGDRYVYRVSPGFEIFDRTTLTPTPKQPGAQSFVVQNRTLAQWLKLESLLDDFENNKQQIENELQQPSPQDGVGWRNPHWRWGSRKTPFGDTGFGPIRNGILYDPVSEKPRLLIWPAYTRTGMPSALEKQGPGVGFWYPFPSRVSNFTRLENAIRQGAHPWAPEILKGKVENNEVILTSSTFSGEVASKLVIKQLPKQVGYNAPQSTQVFVSATADIIRVAYDGRLYLIDREEFPPPEAPFHVEPTQTEFVVTPGQAITLKYKANGARRYSLRIKDNQPPLALRSDDGAFTLRLAPDVVAMTDQFVRGVTDRRQPLEERRKFLQTAIEANQVFYKQVVGREPSGVALPMQVLVDAQSEDLRTTGFFHDVLYEIPKEEIVEALERDHQAFKELQRKSQQERERRGQR